MPGYVDIYLLPVHEATIDDYRDQATAFGTVAKEHGALSYREFRADDLSVGFTAEEGRVLTAAVVEFDSREHRDDVMGKVMKDERVAEMTTEDNELADMNRMQYGGFETFVNP